MTSPSTPVIDFAPSVQDRAKEFLCRTIRNRIEALEERRLRCHFPRPHHLYVPLRGMPYHFKPEIFIQLGGVTEFTFPDQSILVEGGSVCIVPGGLPHGEAARSDKQRFENIVISFYNNTIYVHVAHERNPGQPGVDQVYFYTTDLFSDLISYLDRISELHHRDPTGNAEAVRALLLAEFSLLLRLMETKAPGLPQATDMVSRCKWLIHRKLHDDGLDLEWLACELGCSCSHLSRLFHRDVGERIIEHINRLRIQNATDALRNTRLSAKVIAVGCGYRDAGYFGRVFRRATGRSPQKYRRDAMRISSSLEMQPKTVYAEERSHGAVPDLGEMNALDALRLTKLSVKAIAAGCGYRDAKVFGNIFRQATGISPQRYRRDIQRIISTEKEPHPKGPAPPLARRKR